MKFKKNLILLYYDETVKIHEVISKLVSVYMGHGEY